MRAFVSLILALLLSLAITNPLKENIHNLEAGSAFHIQEINSS